MCTLYLPSLLYAVISLLFNCPQSARAVVTDTLSLTSPPVNPNCVRTLGLRDRTMPRTAVAPPRAAGTQQSLPSIKCYDHNQAEYLGATRATSNKGELGAVCHALMGARELARAGEEVLIFSRTRRSRFAPRLAHGRHASARRWSSATGEPWRPYERSRRHDSAVPARPGTCRPRNE
jgi:hypothetical protein